MKTLYIVIWHEAIEAADLIAGIFDNEVDAKILHDDLVAKSSGDYWEIVIKHFFESNPYKDIKCHECNQNSSSRSPCSCLLYEDWEKEHSNQ